MVSAPTLHVVSTELAVGSFAMAGVAFAKEVIFAPRGLGYGSGRTGRLGSVDYSEGGSKGLLSRLRRQESKKWNECGQ